MTAPAWLAALAGLDDEALAAFGNRGLLRRALRLVADGAATVVDSSDEAVDLQCEGVVVRLLPGGPAALRCPCPVAGVCVHKLVACVWARTASVPGDAASDAPAADVLADVLAWEPLAVNRSAGIAAVRRVAKEVNAADVAAGLRVEPRGHQLVVSWPDSPTIVVVPGAGVPGMLVEGTHSEVAERAWKLAALVRVFAAHGRSWPWPDGLDDTSGLQPTQRDAAAELVAAAEAVIRQGLARVDPDGSARLSRAGQRAKLDDLPLLTRLATLAASQVKSLHERDDDVDESAAFTALAEAWALGRALTTTSPPDALFCAGTRATEPSVRRVTPLAVRWWNAPSGARGLTWYAWDETSERLETATTGRAAGTDPSFVLRWNGPMLWGLSPEQLSAGPVALAGVERRDDGTLSPTSRTTATPGTWGPFDVGALAAAVNRASEGAAQVSFGRPAQRITMILPRPSFGLGTVELDEVAQQFVWPVVDTDGRSHRLALDATPAHGRLFTWLIEQRKITAVVALDEEPIAVFLPEGKTVRLISLTASPIRLPDGKASWQRRLLKLDTQRRATAPLREPNPLQRLFATIGDLVVALAATGQTQLTSRQRDTLIRCQRESADLGLTTLATALTPLLEVSADPETLLAVRFLLDRLDALAS